MTQHSASSTAPDAALADGQSLPARSLSWVEVWAALLALGAVTTALGLALGQILLPLVPTLAVLICLVAAWFDAGHARIPNPLTYTATLIGVGMSLLGAVLLLAGQGHVAGWLGAPTIGQSLLGLVVCGGIGLGCLILAGMGGGDLKLLAAIGALFGFSAAWPILIWGLAVAVVFALLNLLLLGRLNWMVRNLALQWLNLVYLRQLPEPARVSKTTIPLAVPLVIGLLLSKTPWAADAWAWAMGG